MFRLVLRLLRDDSGISSVEYALLLAFVASGIIMGATDLSSAVSGQMTDTAIRVWPYWAKGLNEPCDNEHPVRIVRHVDEASQLLN